VSLSQLRAGASFIPLLKISFDASLAKIIGAAFPLGEVADHRINRDELFLPLLSVLSFTDLSAAIADDNDVVHGLTAGCYAQDRAGLEAFLERAEAGVLYANRASGATTGAWPGIQSFCGWKGSGVTSKGGLGPYYLPQFMREQSRLVWKAG
jgi:1-pyrroline-5-carboxylate dehydrogenase